MIKVYDTELVGFIYFILAPRTQFWQDVDRANKLQLDDIFCYYDPKNHSLVYGNEKRLDLPVQAQFVDMKKGCK